MLGVTLKKDKSSGVQLPMPDDEKLTPAEKKKNLLKVINTYYDRAANHLVTEHKQLKVRCWPNKAFALRNTETLAIGKGEGKP